MQISVILAHPDPNSFNHAIAHTAVDELKQHTSEINFHDLYEERFNPLLPVEEFPKDAALPPEIEAHCREIASADGIIIVHPNWWGQPPAILKGWVDRVIRPGVAYEFLEEDQGEGVPNGLLQAQAALILNTSNTETQREIKVFGDPLEAIWKNCIFDLCGVKKFHRHTFNIIVVSTDAQRRDWLMETRKLVQEFVTGIRQCKSST